MDPIPIPTGGECPKDSPTWFSLQMRHQSLNITILRVFIHFTFTALTYLFVFSQPI